MRVHEGFAVVILTLLVSCGETSEDIQQTITSPTPSNKTRLWQDEGVFPESIVNQTLERAARSFAAAVDHRIAQPHTSSLDPWRHDYARNYFRFRNVQLYSDRLAFRKGNLASAEQLPQRINLDGRELRVEGVRAGTSHSRRNLSASNASCNGWIDKPTVLIQGTQWQGNIYEWVTNSFMPLWGTTVQEGLLPADRYLNASFPPTTSEAEFNVIHGSIAPYRAKWSYWFDYMTPNQWLLDQVDGQCFADLTIVQQSLLQFMNLNGSASYVTAQAALVKAFQRWIYRVEDLAWRGQGLLPPGALADSVPHHRPRVIIASRPKANPYNYGFASRGMVNEDELVAYIAANYDVNVTKIVFKGRMEETISIMQQSDLVIGVHGAGLTNALWMRPGSHMIQIIPHGWVIRPAWNPDKDWLIRGRNFKQLCRALGMTYSEWVNSIPENAFFHERDFDRPEDFQEHPTPDMPRPADWNASKFWLHQDTRVDLESFQIPLGEAMTKLNVPRIHRVLS